MLSTDEIIRTIADGLPVGVWVARAPGGELVYANQTFAEIMGMGARDDVGAGGYAAPYGIRDRTGAPYAEERMPFARAMRERTTVTVDDLVIHRHDGQRVYVRAFARPFFAAGGEVELVAIAFIDISREVEAELHLRRAQRMESIGTLAGGIAHDFNNLLAPLTLVTASLLREETDPRRQEGLQIIMSAANRAAALTQALLGFIGRGERSARPLALDQLVRSLAAIIKHTLDGRIELRLELDAEAGATIGDATQLEQAVMNLLVNARDAMAQGGTLTVRLFARGEDRLALEVSDTGPGIDPAIRDRIFEPYFTTKPRGSGLGLATVYGIVRSHGGAIEILDGAPGTTMRLVLPRVPSSAVSPTPAPPGPPVRGTGTILIVDDDTAVRDAVARTLGDLGYKVIEAGGGLQAVAQFHAHRQEVRAVILDVGMPHMGGRQTFLALRDIDPGVRVMLLTAQPNDGEARALLALGARALVPKPCPPEKLSTVLASVMAS